ncbi:MAG: hypothetical protein Q7J80_17290, partial [Anaerolineales bacterium]|nr:hypothetical protein [Anaerolineales bacterium]
MKKILPFSLIITATLILAACGGGARSQTQSYAATESPAMMELPAMAPEAGMVADKATSNSGSS